MFKHIVAAVDYSDCAFNALELAGEIAKSQHASLDILNVIDPVQAVPPVMDPYGTVQPWLAELNEEAVKLLQEFAAKMEAAGLSVKTTLLDGPPAATIVDFARTVPADLIVIGSHGRKGLSRLMLGSVAESVMRDAPCPVLVVHDSPKAALAAQNSAVRSSKESAASVTAG